jgi:ribose 5-phosphate isomerase B
MKIAFGCDHRGYQLKNELINYIRELSEFYDIQYDDFGVFSEKPVDYPDYIISVCESVSRGEFDYGVVICLTGQGSSIVANKVKGIRAALCLSPTFARLAREHNDANILALAGGFTSFEEAKTILLVFLNTKFLGGRHRRRINKILDYERRVK